jgi:hypothetical protein
MEHIYYSPTGYWRGTSAIDKLSKAAKVSRKVAKSWLEKQAIWQIYLPAPKRIHRPVFDEYHPNAVHQADLLFLPHDKVGRKTYKYALTVVDIASRYKEAEPLTDKSASAVADAFSRIYKRGPLIWPNVLQVDPGREFFGVVNHLFQKNKTQIRRGIVGLHRQQAIVERFNRTLAERLFGHQYYKEISANGRGDERCREWATRLPEVIHALNNEKTQITDQKPSDAIKLRKLKQVHAEKAHAVLKAKPALPVNVFVRYLYEPGELEGGTTRRATDPVWSITVHRIASIFRKPDQPVLYYLEDGPKRSFVREELQVIPVDSVQTLE